MEILMIIVMALGVGIVIGDDPLINDIYTPPVTQHIQVRCKAEEPQPTLVFKYCETEEECK